MAFGFEMGIDPELLRQLQVGVSGFVLLMVMIMFHNTVTKIEKRMELPTKQEIIDGLKKAKSDGKNRNNSYLK